MASIRSKFKAFFSPFTNINSSPASLLVTTAMMAFLYVFMEWLFIFTRPSYLQTIPFTEKLLTLVTSAGLLTLVCFLLLSPFILLGALIKKKTVTEIFSALVSLIPAFLLTSLALMLLDNFTYTVFHFGIVSTKGAGRAIYTTLYVVLGIYFYTRLIEFTALLTAFFSRWQPTRRRGLLVIMILLASSCALLPANTNPTKTDQDEQNTAASRGTLPDILLITVDGVNAEYTSIYGAERDTTPFLRGLADDSLLALNAFADAQGTIGSLTSLLTGKYPTDVRVINSSDMLQEADAYQHLPGILKEYGYYTVQFSNAVYTDAYKVNFQQAFDEANGRSISNHPLLNALSTLYPGTTYIFQQEVIERLLDRLGHLFFLHDMSNPYEQVTTAPKKFEDSEKMEQVISLLEKSEQPLFIHIHWMGTHGPNYFPDQQDFSAGIEVNDQESNKQLFYYDSILEFDQAVAHLYQYLSDTRRLDDTILVVASDHSQKWTNARLPLLIHFPGGENAHQISENVENLDIAPTLLDYLDIPQPQWMAGQSLLTASYEAHPIFTAKIPKSTKNSVTGKVVYPESEPPFYQFGRISVVVCDQWYELDLNQMKMTSGWVTSYSTPCQEEIDPLKALDLVNGHLQRYGFDTNSLVEVRNQLEDAFIE